MEVAHRKLLDHLRSFTEFTPAELDALAGVMQVRRFRPGQALFSEGELADACYLVAAGCVQVSVMRAGQPEQLAILGNGDLLGQMAVLDGGRRSATCTALEETTVLYLGKSDFDQLVRGGSSFALKFIDALTRMLVAQLRYANRRLLTLAEQHTRPKGGESGNARKDLFDVARHTFSCSLRDLKVEDLKLVPEKKR